MNIEIILIAVVSMVGAAAAMYFYMKSQQNQNQPQIATDTNTDTEQKKPEKVVNKPLVVNKEEEQRKINAANNKANAIVNDAKNKSKQIIINAKSEAIKIKEKADRDAQSTRDKSLDLEKKAEERFDEIYKKSKEVEEKEKGFAKKEEIIKAEYQKVNKIKEDQIKKLENISSLTKEEARKVIINDLENELKNDLARKIKEYEEQYKANVDSVAKELLADAMHNASTDYVPEYTISTVKLSDKDIKGRIIGKEGRNIKSFEDITGVNVDFEEDNEVRLSSFDAVRREVARISLERLIKDGRIQPSRIEEIVSKVKTEIDKVVYQSGNELCQAVGVYNLPNELVMKLGNFKYRTSYGQNMIQHTLEETRIGVKLAHEIDANVNITKLACLLHDIGKVVTDKEGNHIELGVDYLKKFNIPKEVLTAIAEHHEDKPSSVEGVLVQIADSISGSRPGARYEDFENYVKRMKDLEQAAASFDGVERAYAISAGRELRVIVKPEEITDAEAVILSQKISDKIEEEQTFPGTIKVVVIREVRAMATAA